MIESLADDILLHIVPLHDEVHSALNSPSILFIRNITQGHTYYFGLNHPDVQSVDRKQLVEMLNAFTGRKWAVDKKAFVHMLPVTGLLDVGFAQYLRENKVFELSEFETPAHALVRRNFAGKPGFGRFVPLVKHLEAFSELSETCEKIIKKARVDDSFLKFNEMMIEPLAEVEKRGLAVDIKEFEKHFGYIFASAGKVYTQYYFYTSTGRPSNRFGGVNYAALNKEDGSRKAFVSRFGKNGKLILIDYSTFHPRIVSHLTNYPVPFEVDIYEYLAKLYFNKTTVDESDIADSKKITFRQFYGGVEEKYRHIKYLAHMKDFIDYHWSFFNRNHYVETPIFKRKITDKHILIPKPATVFNYIMQAVEGEISIPILGAVNEYLRNKQSKCVLYTYDSILLDYCLDDGDILGTIKTTMELDRTFPTKVYFGDNYHDMELVT